MGYPSRRLDAPRGYPMYLPSKPLRTANRGLRRAALGALAAAAAAGALAADAERVVHPAARWEPLIALAWAAFPLVLAARACVAAQQRGWSRAWQRAVAVATGALALASVARAAWARTAAAEDALPALSTPVASALLAAAAAA